MCNGIIPSHIVGFLRMDFQQGFQQLCNFLSPFSLLNEHDRFSGMVMGCSQAVMHFRLSRRWDHHLLSSGTPHFPQGGQPTYVEFIRIIKDFIVLQPVSGVFNRLFLTWYSVDD